MPIASLLHALCLPSYQTDVLDLRKKYISLDVFFCIVNVFLEVYTGLQMGAGLMGPETCIELGEIEVRRDQEVVKRPL